MSLWTPVKRIFAPKSNPEVAQLHALVERMYGSNVFDGYADKSIAYEHPDDLVRQKGLAIYRQMMDRDDMVSSAYAYLMLAALSTGWTVEPASDDAVDQGVAAYVEHAFESMSGSFLQTLLNVLDAIPMGFCVCEPVWAEPERTEWGMKQGYARISHKNPVYIRFSLDEFGQIAENGIWQETGIGGGGMYNKFDRRDLIYWAWDTKDDSPYGRSPSRRAYRWYFFKDGVARLWARYVERFGFPIIEGVFPKGSNEDDKTTLKALLKEFRTSQTFIRGADWEVNVHDNMSHYSQSSLFQQSLQHCNRGIARAIWLPALVMEMEGATGSYALGKEHNNQFVWILNFVRDALADVVNDQVIAPLVRHNFAEGTACPSWQMQPFSDEDLKAKAEMMEIVGRMGLPISTAYLRAAFSIPELGEDDEPAVPRGGTQPEGGGYQMPGMDEEVAEEGTEMAWDKAHGEMRPKVTRVHMGGNGKQKPDWLEAVEAHCNFAEQKIDEDIAVEYWGEVAGIHFEKVGQELADQAGKERGARLNR